MTATVKKPRKPDPALTQKTGPKPQGKSLVKEAAAKISKPPKLVAPTTDSGPTKQERVLALLSRADGASVE